MRDWGRYCEEVAGCQESDSFGHPDRLDVALWTFSLGHEPRTKEMFTFVKFSGLGQ